MASSFLASNIGEIHSRTTGGEAYITTLPQTAGKMVRGHPPHVSCLSAPTDEVVIGPRENGFPGPAAALDGPVVDW